MPTPIRTKESIRLVKLYKDAANELLAVIKGTQPSPYKKVREAKLREVVKILSALDIKSKKWVDKNIPKFYRQGKTNTIKAIPREPEFPAHVEKVDKTLISNLIDDANVSYGQTIRAMGVSSQRALSQIQKAAIQDKILKGAIKGTSGFEAKTEIVKYFEEKGFTGFRANGGSGRRFTVQDYSDLISRSQIARAQNLGAEQALLDAGRRYARIDTIIPDIDGDDICNRWEGKIIDLTKAKIPSKINPNPIIAKPPFHPRCRHSIDPVSFKELQKGQPKLYSKALTFYKKSA